MFSTPISDFLKTHKEKFFMHFGEGAMSDLIDFRQRNIESRDETALCLDWSEFDKRVPTWLINKAFDIIWRLFESRE